jgi:hypothetical protein
MCSYTIASTYDFEGGRRIGNGRKVNHTMYFAGMCLGRSHLENRSAMLSSKVAIAPSHIW